MHEDAKIRNPHIDKEGETRQIIQLVQSRCRHRRRGVISEEGHNVLYCQDCGKIFYNIDI